MPSHRAGSRFIFRSATACVLPRLNLNLALSRSFVFMQLRTSGSPARLIVKLAFVFFSGRARTFSFAAITVFSPPWITASDSVIRFGFRPR